MGLCCPCFEISSFSHSLVSRAFGVLTVVFFYFYFLDLDVKATALLKLVYLEMVGYDMSWASFHVLEVMSSPKYHQKRVGYLGAVQSFRPDTEVLMLATNLLKKVKGIKRFEQTCWTIWQDRN